MSKEALMLKPAEAAFVAEVPLRDVNRAIDEEIIPNTLFSTSGSRLVAEAGCSFIGFYVGTAKALTSAERLGVIRRVSGLFRRGASFKLEELLDQNLEIAARDYLIVRFAPFVEAAKQRLDRLVMAREIVVSDPDILSGTPVIRGTRVPVHDVAACVEAGLPRERILAAYPSLATETVDLACVYAQANPLRGRPGPLKLPEEARVISVRSVPRIRFAG